VNIFPFFVSKTPVLSDLPLVRYKKINFYFTDPPLDFKTSGKKTCILVSEITNLASLSVTLPLLFDTILTDLIL
jgi:hypothetical protein